MPSVVPGFEYDIFISYRHNDNRSGWVTDFVNALQEELAATIKEPLTLYFDKNPHYGLLETHDVDKSLEGKLKCLIFIPILSQTYCDPKSFAWQHEFCAFNKIAKEDFYGRDIKLGNGNVASRILPVKIHDLDGEDKAILENEISGVLRSIEFICKSSGVNRPLTPSDKKEDNINKTQYKDQLNKTANAVKELINAIKNPSSTKATQGSASPAGGYKLPTNSISIRKKVFGVVMLLLMVTAYVSYHQLSKNGPQAVFEKSIAVLPFVDMSPNHNQEYLSDGIAEDIITALSKVEGMKVIGRTSSFQFKGEKIDLREVGEKLNVSTVLEGSVMKADNKIRVTAQLINVSDGSHIWSEKYDKPLNDIFTVQDEIAQRIAEKFKVTMRLLSESQPATQNLEAYEAYLKAKHAYGKGLTGMEEALQYFEKASALDPTFIDAKVELSDTYWSLAVFGKGDVNGNLAKAKSVILEVIERDPNSVKANALLASYLAVVDWNWEEATKAFEKAVALNEGRPIQNGYIAFIRSILRRGIEESIKEAKGAVELDPLSVKALTDLSRIYLYAREFNNIIPVCDKALSISPTNSSAKRHLGVAYLRLGNYQEALHYFEDLMKMDSTYAPYGYIGALVNLDRKDEAMKIYKHLPRYVTPVKLAICNIYLNQVDSAFYYLNKGLEEHDISMPFLKIDSEYDPIRSDRRFQDLINRMKLP